MIEYANAARTFSGCPQGSFINSQQEGFVYYFASGLASLGFIVVTIDGRGTPLRNKAFADHHYGDPAFTSDFADRIEGLQQLAKCYPAMDLERVGIVSPEHPTNA
jgi:dipeptidyl-peptidase-4